MFTLYQQTAKLAQFKPRIERHGEEPAGAADLYINFTDSNIILSELHPRLRHAFYRIDDSERQESMVPAEPTQRVFGDLVEELKFKHELKGAAVVIGFGLGGPSDIVLDPVDVLGFSAVLMEGGSVNIAFRIKCHPTSEQAKKLYEVMGREITVTITPAVEKQGSRCIYNGAHALPAPSAPGDAQDERQAFEAWFTRNDATKDMADRAVRRDACGEYYLMQTYTAWEIWQAARTSVAAPAAGDALDAARYRIVRQSIADEANGANQVAAASEVIGLERGSYPTPDQFDAIVDHIAAQQSVRKEA
ncbi:Uncharacterised protein [Achromobacter denitrificans]|uniref:hypothetical protein n=1 Tax=Achromobacter denitrificans TaxID=32002 RepID=UPI000965EA47|nr:hypothetical protein [Achromobacter denitrificans]OLU09216.1 hypothetical protein BVK87_06195 [Achromobacter denitrificans]CAB3698730.1 hypothetical protein LMG1231_02473 [Achromobacter denitrificans]SUW33783.1 Uncharacterised protein [Achromobacter denitrificans]